MSIKESIITRYKNVASATVYSAVRRLGYEPCFMRGVESFTPGLTLAGPAKTLRFIPPRKDIMEQTHIGEKSPEYIAMGSCEPGDVLVIDGLGKRYAAIGGDVKLLQLKMREASGLVTDASIRDLDIVADNGLAVFAGGRTPMGGADEIDPFEANVTIQCGGVAVRPGDLVMADDDGAGNVPIALAQQLLENAATHVEWEEFTRLRLLAGGDLRKYYPLRDDARAEYEEWKKAPG